MSSNKMSSRAQVKKTKNQKAADKTDKAMNDVKRIGIISCCLIAILIVIGLFIDTDESYAAGFLTEVPDKFISDVVNGDNDTRPVNNNLIPGIGLPWEFSGYEAIEDKNGELSDTDGKKYNKGNEISFIYCVDRKKDMADNIIYTKGASIKSQVSLDSQNIVNSYPGLIYIILNDNIVENNNLTVPSGQTTETMNYYLAQVAIWYYIDVVNGTDYNFRADEKQTINDSTYGTIINNLVTRCV